MIEAGKILQNRYRIEKQIGQGGMGTVFVAVDERFDSTVAIKETFFEEESLSKAFEREARLLNSLKHPALPKVSDFFAEEKGRFIVMEFISGDDLSEILEKSDKPFSVDEVLNWANQLCDALKYLHTQDMPVIHRDIKPQNLKLTPAGQIILLDFGLAKGSPNDASHKTAAKSIFGYSRNYASLEQIEGTGTDPQSDIYALGATLYHLLTGIPPADALTRAMNILNGKSDPLISANLINKTIPAGVAQVIQQSMALNATERPISAVEMRLMLENCDKTVDPNAEIADLNSPFASELLMQNTKLLSRETNVNESAESELKTKILTRNESDENSAVTKIAGNYATSANRSKNSVFYGGAALSGLLIFGGLGYFMLNPAQSSVESIRENQADQKQILPVNTSVATTNSQIEVENPIDSEGNTSSTQLTPQEQNLKKEKESPSTETAKKSGEPAKKTETSTSSTVSESDDPEEIVIDTDEGKVKIKGERLETDDVIIDENGIKIKNPAKYPGFDGSRITPAQIRRMNPRQRRKYADLIEAQKELKELKKTVPTPPTQPSPDDDN